MEPDLKHDQATHFAFGKNWARYSEAISDQEIEYAKSELKRLLGRDSLAGLRFLDIGCGSGIHAIAALRLGAEFVHAVDIDQNSVRTTESVLSRFWRDRNYKVETANVFDMTTASFGTFGIVYSWGVLHHTGDMWGAIKSASRLVENGGTLAIAIYRKTRFCGMWRAIKERYVRGGPVFRGVAVGVYMTIRIARDLLRLKNPVARIREHKKKRGMHWYVSVVDWIGGFPYESATCDPQLRRWFCPAADTSGERLGRRELSRSAPGRRTGGTQSCGPATPIGIGHQTARVAAGKALDP